MRILITTQYRTVVGGVETYLRSLLRQLCEAGHEVALFTEEPLIPASEDIVVDGPALPCWDATGIADAAAWQPDFVYYHRLSSSDSIEFFYSKFPVVSYIHNYNGSCISGTKCTSQPVYKPCERKFGLACLALYLPLRCGGLNPVSAVKLYCKERESFRTSLRSHAVLVASQHMADEVIRNGVPAEKVHVAHLPLTATRDPQPPERRRFTGRILYVGRITDLKGWQHLVQAMPRAEKLLGRELDLVVAGDGPDRAAFEKETQRAGLTSKFLGWVKPEQREAEMRNADLLVVPSVWPEPFGLVGVEAGCVGLPSVAYEVGGIPDWLIPGVSGESAPGIKPNPKMLAQAIVRALQDENHWHQLRVGAWENTARFSMEAHFQKLMPILEAAAKR
jgi:glycosyltransferase involved in cell wall biosynthesis